MSWEVRQGDALERLREMPDKSVQTVVTSPPYFGLRDYGTAGWEGGDSECDHAALTVGMSEKNTLGHKGYLPPTNAANVGRTQQFRDTCGKCGARRIDSQLGLEPTPEEFVANLVGVFREVRRILRSDGTVWLNLGDSYASSGTMSENTTAKLGVGADGVRRMPTDRNPKMVGQVFGRAPTAPGLKPKDLCGIPWSIAKALQAPQYTGRIAQERDRVWLAAILDGEGTICGFTHERKDDGRTRTGVHVFITNSDERLLDEANRIWPASRSEHLRPSEGHLGERETWRWIAHGVEDKQMLMRELYPYLIGKQKQARLAYAFLGLSIDAKRLARTTQAQAVKDKRAWVVGALSRLNHGEDVDVPTWIGEPPSLHEPGWYLRSDIIWSKPNPMPESVTDRPTRAHEYLFLLTKSARYFFDQDAIREPHLTADDGRNRADYEVQRGRAIPMPDADVQRIGTVGASTWPEAGRNRRSVWEIATQPYPDAHFATFPPKLVEPCILAGSRPQGAMEKPELVESPLGERNGDDPSLITGRAGYNRPRHPDEGTRPITRQEQARYAAQLRRSSARMAMEQEAGAEAFAHYLRTDRAGARPIPHDLLERWIDQGWLRREIRPDPTPADPSTAVVLDPFCGSGTTGVVALRHDRSFIGIELSADYCELARNRIRDDAPLLNMGLEVAA